ncbi:MAG: hypothetical protein ACFE7E_07750 [Candidatus Hodarchaeota archaeon]
MGVKKGIFYAIWSVVSMAVLPFLGNRVAASYGFHFVLLESMMYLIIAIAAFSAILAFLENALFETNTSASAAFGITKHFIYIWYILTFLGAMTSFDIGPPVLPATINIEIQYLFLQILLVIGIIIKLVVYSYQAAFAKDLRKVREKSIEEVK